MTDRDIAYRKGYADIPDGQVHYARVDGTGDPVIFIHKTVSTYRMWLPVMAHMPSGITMIAFDTPGFGESFDPEGEVAIATYANWIGQAIRALGIKAAHIVGHHTGAAIAMDLAAQAPDLVITLGLIGPLPLTVEERAKSAAKFNAPFTPRKGGGHMVDALAYIMGAGADTVELQNREMSAMLRSWQTRAWTYSAVWKQDFAELFQNASMPLAIQCSRDDALWEAFVRARELRPDALAIELSGGQNYQTDRIPAEVANGIIAQMMMSKD